MGEINTYLSIELVNRSVKGSIFKDILHIQLYFGIILIPFICYFLSFPAPYYLYSLLAYYALVLIIDLLFFSRKRKYENRVLGKLYFSEYGIHVKWIDNDHNHEDDEGEDYTTYDYEDILQISIRFHKAKGSSNPFDVFFQSAYQNKIDFVHKNNIYHYHFITFNEKDSEKLFLLARKLIPYHVHTKFYAKNSLIVDRIAGELLSIPGNSHKDVWKRFYQDLNKVEKIMWIIFLLFLLLFAVYLSIIFNPIVALLALALILGALSFTIYKRYS